MASDDPSDLHFDFEPHVAMQPSDKAHPSDVHMQDGEDGDASLGNHGLKDLQQFTTLDTRVKGMEHKINNLNNSLTSLSTMFTEFMKKFSAPGPRVTTDGGATHDVSPPIVDTSHVAYEGLLGPQDRKSVV